MRTLLVTDQFGLFSIQAAQELYVSPMSLEQARKLVSTDNQQTVISAIRTEQAAKVFNDARIFGNIKLQVRPIEEVTADFHAVLAIRVDWLGEANEFNARYAYVEL